MRNWLFFALMMLPHGAMALDAACTTTTNLGMARCPEDSTDWYESYTDQIDELDALAKTAKSSFTSRGTIETPYGVKSATAVITYVQASSITTTGGINALGRMGIGTIAPSYQLEVKGEASAGAFDAGGIKITNTGAGGGNWLLAESGAARVFQFKDGGITAPNSPLSYYGSDLRNGVGINTDAVIPRGDLDIRHKGSAYTVYIASANNTTAMAVMTADGSVGIGTASPATKLHMSSGTLTVDGTGAAMNIAGSTFTVLNTGVVSAPSQPYLKVQRGASQDIANNVLSAIFFDTRLSGTNINHSITVASATITVLNTGRYAVHAQSALATFTNASHSLLYVLINTTVTDGVCSGGTVLIQRGQAGNGAGEIVYNQGHDIYPLTANDTLTMCVSHSSGGTKATAPGVQYNSLTVYKVP